MKTLVLLRHAHAGWEHGGIPDINRPLDDAGRREVPNVGERLAKRKIVPDQIISSPAERCLHTAKIIAPYLQMPAGRIQIADELYNADPEVLLSIAQLCDGNVDCLMLVGHNPGITQFAHSLTDVPIENLPTCGALVARFDIKAWHELEPACGDYVAFEHPKKY